MLLDLGKYVQQYLEGCITAAELNRMLVLASAEVADIICSQQQDNHDVFGIRPDEGQLAKSQVKP